MHTGFIKPNILSDEDMEECLATVTAVRPVIDKWAKTIYGSNEIKKFRRDYEAGRLRSHKIPLADCRAIETLRCVADKLLASIVLQLGNIAWTFTNSRIRPTLDYDDYFQEACSAAYDAMYNYNGSVQFNTFAVSAARNRLVDLVRLGKRTLEPLSEQVIGGGDGENTITLETLAVDTCDEEDTDNEYDSDMMWRAIREAQLTSLERELFDAYLASVKGFQAEIARLRGTTRSWCNQCFKKACAKIRDTYDSLCHRKIAA